MSTPVASDRVAEELAKLEAQLGSIMETLLKMALDLHRLWEMNDRLYGNELKETTDEETEGSDQQKHFDWTIPARNVKSV
jgi:hypothetical protein